MSRLRCYGPAIVLLIYAAVRILGATSDGILYVFMVIEAVSIWIHIHDLRVRLHENSEIGFRR